ncbi:hypothetical protein [Nonomuraea rubra]|uniref:hypothetical protein n=1 Tax=Nonomuraea rubra TaxID=46180 RepID=UPI003401B734
MKYACDALSRLSATAGESQDLGPVPGTFAALWDLLGREGFDSAFADGYRMVPARLAELLPASG